MSEKNGSARLNQILAIEKGVKERVQKDVTALYHAAQKPALFGGFVKTFRKQNEQGEDYPPERQKVQVIAEDAVALFVKNKVELADVMATKDWANCNARADIVVDGKVLITSAPATFILAIEKELTDFRTFLSHLPVLDEADDWDADPNSKLFKTKPTTTHRTAKVQEPVVLYPATAEHPAQTQLVTRDVIVGFWEQVKHSGALPAPRKQALLEKVEKLLKAVKVAREQANMADAPKQEVGALLFGFVLS